PAGQQSALLSAARTVGVGRGVGLLGQDVEAGEQTQGFVDVEVVDGAAPLLVEPLQRQEAQQGGAGGHPARARIGGRAKGGGEADVAERGKKGEGPRQAGTEAAARGQAQGAAVGDRREFGPPLWPVAGRRAVTGRYRQKGGCWPAAQRARKRVTCWRKA